MSTTLNLIPNKDPLYVSWGNFADIKSILKSQMFFNIMVTGLSGNGKTTMIEQVCAELGRKLVRVNIVYDTDENDLLGGFRLVDGNTVWFDGPVTLAMKEGAVLLLDEVDLGSPRIMCLQPVLEGKPILLKKTGEIIYPSNGFTVVATANTKGKGSDDGRFIGTQILNEAFLDRFPITIEQDYPSQKIEGGILENVAKDKGIDTNLEDNAFFLETLLVWASDIRKSFNEGAVNEVISTRRLVDIIKAYSIYNNPEKSIKMCISRFDDITKTAFLEKFQVYVSEERQKRLDRLAKEKERLEKDCVVGILNENFSDKNPIVFIKS